MKIQAARYYFIYILTNAARDQFETGVTGDLNSRLLAGTQGLGKEDSHGEDSCSYLVHFEYVEDGVAAIKREAQIRSYSRKKKSELIDQSNPGWRFLNEDVRSPDHLLGRQNQEPQR